jgi:hypothetical protein
MEEDTHDIEDTNKVKEPGTAYTGPTQIRIFTSFSESEEDQYRHWARLSPEERLSEFYEIMNRFYVYTTPAWKGIKIKLDE